MRFWGIILVLAGVFAWQHRSDINNWLNPPEPINVPGGTQVVLYATEWCGYCAKTREMLSARSVPYREFDIEKSNEGFAQYQRLNGNGVPVLVIGSEVIHGFNESKIESALKKL